MPQMSPLWWLTLYIMFIMCLMITNSMNYHLLMYSIKSKNMNKMIKNQLNWKW